MDVPLLKSDEQSPAQLVAAMEKAIDVMQRAGADSEVKAQTNKEWVAGDQDVTQIGDYSFTLLEGMADHMQLDSGQQHPQNLNQDLTYMVVVVALWVARHGGRIDNIDMVVNALAGYANYLREAAQLSDLCPVIRDIIVAVSDDIQKDLEQTNPLRPWKVLNLNYGIVATRSHNPRLIEEAYDLLVKNLPQDAREFFREGMKQMDIVGYPQEVRAVVEKYDRLWGADSTLH